MHRKLKGVIEGKYCSYALASSILILCMTAASHSAVFVWYMQTPVMDEGCNRNLGHHFRKCNARACSLGTGHPSLCSLFPYSAVMTPKLRSHLSRANRIVSHWNVKMAMANLQ